MRRGVWHQFGNNSQNLIAEQLQHGNGVGVVLSPRDLSLTNAVTRSAEYRGLGADVVIDLQFYEPEFQNSRFASYEMEAFRQSVSSLCKLGVQELSELARHIERVNREVGACAILAPALVYEAGRPDIVDLNARMFGAAKAAGDSIGIPTYGSIVLGMSTTRSLELAQDLLSSATSMPMSAYYFAVELDQAPIAFDPALVSVVLNMGLTLAATGTPILHAYAGYMGLLSLGVGVDGVAFGHSHNLRHFTRERWQEPQGQGGAGPAPPRYFSSNLWGTIVLPDETTLARALWARVQSPTPFSPQSFSDTNWSRWEANKHLLHNIGTTLTAVGSAGGIRAVASEAISRLNAAVQLHNEIRNLGIEVKDGANLYQFNWSQALATLLRDRSADYDYLELLGK